MSRARAKGTAAESSVVAFLRANGFPDAERRALAGAQDRGDVAGIPGVAIEVKAVARPAYQSWLREARAEWSGHTAAAGIWATTDPVFQLHDTDDAGGLELIGAAEAILGPIEPLSWRTP